MRDGRRTGAGSATTYGELLEWWATASPEAAALVDERGAQSHAELAGRVASLTSGLAGLGVGRGDVVAVWLPNMREWVETAFAAAALGAIALGVNTKLRGYDVEGLLREAAAKVLVTRPGFRGIDFFGMLGEIDPKVMAGLSAVLCVGEPGQSEGATEAPPPGGVLGGNVRQLDYEEVVSGSGTSGAAAAAVSRTGSSEPAWPAQAFTSSGSTGRPKLILHSQEGLLFHAHACAKAFGFDAPDAVVLGALPLCGVFGYNTMLAGLAAGRPVILQPVFTARDALELVASEGVTHMTVSDTMLRMLLDAIPPGEEGRYATWREAAFGIFTAGNPQDIIDAGTRLGKKFFQTYGSSEILALMTYPAAGSGPARWVLGGGQPVAEDIQVRIRTADGRAAAVGEQGEIHVKGRNVTVGLLRAGTVEPVKTDADGFFATGDLGFLTTPRDVVYQSRLGDALRIAGFLVSPREVEAFLETLPQVDQAQYVAVDSERGLVPVAFVTAAPGAKADEAAVRQACGKQLAAFKAPKRVVFVEAFPVLSGANGDKVDKKALRALATDVLAAEPAASQTSGARLQRSASGQG